MRLSELLEQRGLTDEDVSALLEEHGVVSRAGNPITPGGVRKVLSRDGNVPPTWKTALGLDGDAPTRLPPPAATLAGEDGDGAPGGGARSSAGRRREHSPTRPPDAKVLIEPGASKRISGA